MCYINCKFENCVGECTLPRFLPGWLCPHQREETTDDYSNKEEKVRSDYQLVRREQKLLDNSLWFKGGFAERNPTTGRWA